MQKRHSEPPPGKPTWVKFVPSQRLRNRIDYLDSARTDLETATNRLKLSNERLSASLKGKP